MPNDMAKRVENNHDELNLGQILFMLPTERKINIRKLEKPHNVFINNKYAIIFNETCIKEGLLPKYTNIVVYSIYSIYIYILYILYIYCIYIDHMYKLRNEEIFVSLVKTKFCF